MKNSFLNNSRGASLIQVIIAVALLGIVTMGFATMMSQMTASQKVAMARQDIMGITQEVQTMFSSPSTCQNGLVPGTAFNLAQAQAAYPPASGAAITGMPFQFKLNNEVLKTNGTLQNYNVNVERLLMVNAGTAGVDTSGNTIYRTEVVAEFKPKTGNSFFGMKNLVTGFVTVSGGTIATCASSAPVSVEQATTSCEILGGTYNATTKKCNIKPDLADPTVLAELCPQFKGTIKDGKCEVTGSGGTVTTVTQENGRWFSWTHPNTGVIASTPRCPGNNVNVGDTCPKIGDKCHNFTNIYAGLYTGFECK